jgi:hypothetical protein
MTRRKPSRNDPCPCQSGKKIKHCHGDAVRGWEPVDIGNGFTVSAPPTMSLSLVVSQESDLPERLVGMARKASARASEAAAGEYEVVSALLLVNTAAEAVLNRLLEALLPAPEWTGSGKRDGLERASTAKKWVRLSEVLKMKPNLSRDREPLRSFLATVETRNALVHFKHGENVEVVETPRVKWTWGENVTVNAGELVRAPPAAVLTPAKLNGRFTPQAAAGYFDSLRSLLLAVLDHCPEPLAHVASAVRSALTMDETTSTISGTS